MNALSQVPQKKRDAFVAWALEGKAPVEIAKANLDVVRRILPGGPKISPTLIRVRASQDNDLGRVIFAACRSR